MVQIHSPRLEHQNASQPLRLAGILASSPLPPRTDHSPWRARTLGALAVVVCTATAGFLWACWRNGDGGPPDIRADQVHHLYLGVLFAAIGARRRSVILMLIAAVLSADDAWQHLRQVLGTWEYRSPLHVVFAHVLWPLAPVQWLAGWLNRLLG